MINGNEKLKKSTKIILGIISALIIIMILGIALLFNSIRVNDKVLSYLNQFEKYIKDGEYKKAEDILKRAEKLKSTEEGKEKLELINKIRKSENLFDEAIDLMKNEKYEEAKDKLNKIHANEGKIYIDAQDKIKECDDALIDINFAKAKEFFEDEDYDNALRSIEDVLNVRKSDEEAKQLQEEIIQKRDEKLAREDMERKEREEKEKKEREAFTEEEALEFLKEKLGQDKKLFLEVQGFQEIQDKSGYVIKAFMKKEHYFGRTEWYLVDKYNKKAYKWDISNNNFIEVY